MDSSASAGTFELHHESRAVLASTIERAFDDLDDFSKLSAHMEQSSWMMLGSRMEIVADAQKGRAVGSRITMRGTILGLNLFLEEVVTERRPPFRKVWETRTTKLLVIGRYRLGFELAPEGDRSAVRVFIDYDLPTGLPGRWLGLLFAGTYARWCTSRMIKEAVARQRRHDKS